MRNITKLNKATFIGLISFLFLVSCDLEKEKDSREFHECYLDEDSKEGDCDHLKPQ